MAHLKSVNLIVTLLLFCMAPIGARAQQPIQQTAAQVGSLPKKFIASLQQKAGIAEKQLQKTTDKLLKKLRKQEQKLYKALLQQNPEAAHAIFVMGIDSLAKMQQVTNNVNVTAEGFHPWVDSMQASLGYLQTDSGAAICTKNTLLKIPQVQQQLQQLQGRLASAEKLQALIAERRLLIQQQLLQYPGLQKMLGSYTKQAYYYKAKLAEYKSLLSNRKKAETAALNVLRKIPAFKRFISKYSYLGNLLASPANNVGSYGQTNAYVTALINSNGPGAMQQIRGNIQAGQSQLEQLKAKLGGASGSSDDIPSFKPNEMRKKSFFKRLSLGTNYQFTAAQGAAPQMLDVGFQVAYQFNKHIQGGLGMGYRLGLGKNLRQLVLSSEGLSVRSFFDARIKGGIYASGGFEMQYNTRFYQLRQLQQTAQWNQLALFGISKKMNLGKKASGGISIQYNFLAHKQPGAPNPWTIRYHVGKR